MGSSTHRPQDGAFVEEYNHAIELGSAGDNLRGAIVFTRSLCARYPTYADAWSHLSALLIRRKEYREAFAVAQDALTRDPEHSGAHINAGVAARWLGDLEVSRRHLEEAVRIAPFDPDAQLQLGGTLVRLHQTRTAIDVFCRAIGEAHREEHSSTWLIERSIDGLAAIKSQDALDEPLRSLHDGARWLVTGDLVNAYRCFERARDAVLDDEAARRAPTALLEYVWRQHALTAPPDPNGDRDLNGDNIIHGSFGPLR